MWIRPVIALLGLVNALVATYLHLWKLGKVGELTCSAGHGCEIVQLSSWGQFLGVDVALIGAVGYTLLLITALAGTTEKAAGERWPSVAVLALVVPAFLFTLRLKYAEFVILKTFCPWCAISAVSITVCLGLALLDWRRRHVPAQ